MSTTASPYAESQCNVRTTPLRAFNANVAVLYIALAAITIIVTWFNSSKTGASTFDTNVYRLSGRYSGNYVIPPSGVTSMVALTPMIMSLAMMGALIIGGLFHFVYALDCRRLYTLLLVDRCNGMRWAQYAIIHTILGLIVAQLTGTTTYDFMMFALFALPCLGVLGCFGDRSYPCSPSMSNLVTVGQALLLIAFWTPVITNFGYRYSDSSHPPPPYMWIALFVLGIYDILIFISPWIISRHRIPYFVVEIASPLLLLFVSAMILVCVGWGTAEQQK